MHAGKTGFLYILDRVTGKPLIGIPEKPVRVERRMKTAANLAHYGKTDKTQP